MPIELTIRAILVEKEHWPAKFLSWDQRMARLDIRDGVSGFRPFRRWRRWLNKEAFLPVERVIWHGCEIKFSPLLRHDRIWIGLIDYGGPGSWRAACDLPGGIARFLFDEWLAVQYLDVFDFVVHHPGVGLIKVSHLALIFLAETMIRTSYYDDD